MKKILLLGCFTGLLIFAMTRLVSASSLDVDFYRITSNSPLDIRDQLHLSILDQTSAATDYSISIGLNQALFIFTNRGSTLSSIKQIYIDDSRLNLTLGEIHNISGTDFSAEATPHNLPSGANLDPDFMADINLSAQAKGKLSNGLDEATDALGIVYNISPTTSLMDYIGTAIKVGDLRIGLHVQSITGDTSDAYVNAVPEPATMLLFGIGIVGLVSVYRRKKK